MDRSALVPDAVLRGPLFPEMVHVLRVSAVGSLTRVIGRGMDTGTTHERLLTADQLALLDVVPTQGFDGDATAFRLGVEALRLGLAYAYDPYFSLSIARVDPLPHQLEAVYDYFLAAPRIRFLLADDPGAGKTIMAGLLLKELKARGLVQRVLIITPANLLFQWQRELKDRFHETFRIIRSAELRANYGSNPWQEHSQVITSVSWASTIDDARDSLLRSHWDLVVVDEAHKMSAADEEHKTLAYKLGEELSQRTDHLLLMTATPHKGNPDHFRRFLALLDADVYADVASLEQAMREQSAPFYLRRTKEALVTFPDPVTGKASRLFRDRHVRTAEFELSPAEYEFYESLTHYVEEQSMKASADGSSRGRMLQFSMALLQRRFASSVYAARRSLERMCEKREKILTDPEAHRQAQIAKRLPEDFDDLEDDERQRVMDDLETVVASVDTAAIRDEITSLRALVRKASALEELETETKLSALKAQLTENEIFSDPETKLLIFTEHKDTLDYLVMKLREWKLSVTTIHGGMKIGDRDQPETRLSAEREFRESAQVMVATEAAGEGINLQFCHFMVNYDIPWNPMRLEQRMGRIHRYGQTHDCLVLNFVARNTREGRVLSKLLERLMEIRKDLGDQVFDVIGEVLPAAQLERLMRELYARQLSEDQVQQRIVADVDVERFRRITDHALEGLAKKSLNLSAIYGRSLEAQERRLVPEVVEGFFVTAAPRVGLQPRQSAARPHLYALGRVPGELWRIGEEQEPRFGALGKEYRQVVFDRELLEKVPTADWVTPGHALFEAVRTHTVRASSDDLRRGAVFYDLHSGAPYCLDIFSASVQDGRGHCLHEGLFVVQSDQQGGTAMRQPTIFHELVPTPERVSLPPDLTACPIEASEEALLVGALEAVLADTQRERIRESDIVQRHLCVSLDAIIDRLQRQLGDLETQRGTGTGEQGLEGRIVQLENRLAELNHRRDTRLAQLQQERHCAIGGIQHLGRAWVLPHPERDTPALRTMVRDDEVERIAVGAATRYEEARGWRVESVESQNRGFDLVSRLPHPEDPETSIEVRFIEVKGRAGVGEVALSRNEYETSQRLRADYWLYVVFSCGSTPEVIAIHDPARLGWQPVQMVEHYHLGPDALKGAGW